MIDWLSVRIPYFHQTPINGGEVIALDPSGEILWKTQRKMSLEGSYSSKIQIKSMDRQSLHLSGNPSKFLQGHNIFGSNDVLPLAYMFFVAVLEKLGLPISHQNHHDWLTGQYQITTIDITESFRLPHEADVDTWIRAASQLIRGKHQGVSAYGGETIYVGQKSRRISLKIYNKHKEIQKHRLHKDLPMRDELEKFARGLLRVEVRLHSQELKRRDLAKAENWNPSLAHELLRERIMNLEMPHKMRLTTPELRELPPRLLAVVKLWEQGSDLRALYSKATFYRYRNELRKHGIDICSAPPKNIADKVIPLFTVLEADQVPVPDWAKGTALLACA